MTKKILTGYVIIFWAIVFGYYYIVSKFDLLCWFSISYFVIGGIFACENPELVELNND